MRNVPKDRRGFPYDPHAPRTPLEERRFIVRLNAPSWSLKPGNGPDCDYWSKDHPWRPVVRSKATWLTRTDAEKVRHALAKPRMGYRAATIEEHIP